MTFHPPIGRPALQAYVAGLAVACPLGQNNPCECPLHRIRLMSLHERFDWVNALSDEHLTAFTQHHRNCIQSKEAALHAVGATRALPISAMANLPVASTG